MESDEYKYLSACAEDTEKAGAALGRIAPRGLYLALCGELGGGKTTFVRGLAAGMGAREQVASPTFVLMREYKGAVMPLYHADYYRLDTGADLTGLDIEYCLETGVLASEWADKFAHPEGAPALKLLFEWVSDNERSITISCTNEEAKEVFQKFIESIES